MDMKKLLLSIVVVVIIGGATYSVYSYNKTNSSDSSKESLASNQNTSVTKEATNNVSTGYNSPHINIDTPKIKAIDFKLNDLNGKEVSLSDFKGKKIFLNFFATWCPPCRAEMPEMQKLYEETKDSDLIILAIDLGEDTKAVSNFISNNKYTFNVLLDSNNSAAEKYQIASIPTSYFIDKDGNIIDKHIGSMAIQDMKNYINKLR
jgi:peroxiredoxin